MALKVLSFILLIPSLIRSVIQMRRTILHVSAGSLNPSFIRIRSVIDIRETIINGVIDGWTAVDLQSFFNEVVEQAMKLAGDSAGEYVVKQFNKKQIGLYAGRLVPFEAIDLSIGGGQSIKKVFNLALAGLKTGTTPEPGESLEAWVERGKAAAANVTKNTA